MGIQKCRIRYKYYIYMKLWEFKCGNKKYILYMKLWEFKIREYEIIFL